jgi:DNA protecting protein DprA
MKFPIYSFHRQDSQSVLPKALWEIVEPPDTLYFQGSKKAFEILERLPEDGLAIVGTRQPQSRSIEQVRTALQDLSSSSLIIVSGLARGIDACAHSAALAAGLPTLAVLGAGLDLDYPKQNSELRSQILEADGLLVSEFAPGTPALSHHFLRRNRMIAAWTKATWIVEAAMQSGALNTARWARDQNRICFAVPCFPGDPRLAGNQILLDRDHALPFWGSHSFGAAWLDLAARGKINTSSSQLRFELASGNRRTSDRFLTFYTHIQQLTSQRGGAPITELMDWALSQGWTFEEFFTKLDEALRQKLVIEQFGTLVSTQS